MTLVQSELKSIKFWEPKIVNDMQWPCPDGFHVPLSSEWQTVIDIWTALWWGSSDWTNFWMALKLPFAGERSRIDASVYGQGSAGNYWSSSPYPSDVYYSYNLSFNSSNVSPQIYSFRALGFSVRCFKDSPNVPTSSWTKLYWTSIASGWIFWSATDWLISLSSNWQTWITIADKNLWATTVRNSWNTLSQANCGNHYQWGNNYWFPFTWSVTTSSTQVNASSYWPWNYYESSTFITSASWDSSNNQNLWWWVSQWTSTKSTEIKKVTMRPNGSEVQVRPPKKKWMPDLTTNWVQTDTDTGDIAIVYNWDYVVIQGSNTERWKYYQRWNNYWYSYWSTVSTTSSTKSVSGYWPSNPYSNSTWVNIAWNWMDPNNANIRWWWNDNYDNNRWLNTISSTQNDRQFMCDEWYHIPCAWEIGKLIRLWCDYKWYYLEGTPSTWLPKVPSGDRAIEFASDFNIPFWMWGQWRWYNQTPMGGDIAAIWSSSQWTDTYGVVYLSISSYNGIAVPTSNAKSYWYGVRAFRNITS